MSESFVAKHGHLSEGLTDPEILNEEISRLQCENEQLREIIEHSQGVHYIINLKENRFAYISENVVTLLGYTADEVLENSFRNLLNEIHPDDREFIESEITMTSLSALKKEFRKYFEYRRKTKSGNYKWLCDYATIIYDDSGALASVIGTVYEISARKKNEARLREINKELEQLIASGTKQMHKKSSELEKEIVFRKKLEKHLRNSDTLFHTIFDELPFVVIVLEAISKKLIAVNRTVYERFSNIYDNVVGKKISEVSFLENLSERNEFFSNQDNNQKSYQTELCDKNGEKKLYNFIRHSFFQKDQQYLLIVGVPTSTEAKSHAVDDAFGTHIVSLLEREFEILATELHDDLAQILASSQIRFELFQNLHNIRDENFSTAISLLREGAKGLRDMLQYLKPVELHKFGLTAGLEFMCERISKNYEMDITFIDKEYIGKLAKNAEIFLFRIIQELIFACIKHRHATKLVITIDESDTELTVTFEDNGLAMNELLENNGNSLFSAYLHSIKDRMSYFNGQWKYSSESVMKRTISEIIIPFNADSL